jgi:L-iditol 2-dehydrogenase
VKNKAAVISKPFSLSIIETDIPKLRKDHVLIKVEMVGLCGTDLKIYDGSLGFIKSGQIQFPIIPGHEFYGEIVDIGEDVTGYNIGDKVTSECQVNCGVCSECRVGRHNLCNKLERIGISNEYPGAMAKYVMVPAKNLHKIPEKFSGEQAALIEPTAVALYGVERAGLKGGDKVMVFGPGPIGLLICALAELRGASQIIVVGSDRSEFRLSMAAEMGATDTLMFHRDSEELKRKFHGWADVVFEASGQADSIETALQCVKKGGTFFTNAFYKNPVSNIDFTSQVVVQEKKIVGGIGSPKIWDKTIAIIETGNLPVTRLITHKLPFTDIQQAFDIMYNRLDNVIKPLILMNKG